jgi:hypothetical protein
MPNDLRLPREKVLDLQGFKVNDASRVREDLCGKFTRSTIKGLKKGAVDMIIKNGIKMVVKKINKECDKMAAERIERDDLETEGGIMQLIPSWKEVSEEASVVFVTALFAGFVGLLNFGNWNAST